MRTMGRSWRAVAGIAAVGLVAMFAGAALLGTADRDDVAASSGSAAPAGAVRSSDGGNSGDDGPGPRDWAGGVGVDFDRTEPGAVAAAVSYATAAQNWLYLSDDEVASGVEAVTVPDARDRVVSEAVDQVGLLRDELADASGTVWFVMAPLATRVDTFSSDRAVVRVWLVRVLSADGVAVPQAGWQTLRFELAWLDGDWRIADMDEVEGPTPQLESGLQPWSASYLDQELAGFSRVGAMP